MPDDTVQEFEAYLTAGERELVDRAAEFGHRVVAPNAAAWERAGKHPTEALRDACAAGLANIELSPQWGGRGLRLSAKMRVVEELAKFDFGFAFSLVNHQNALVRVSRAARPLADRMVPKMLAGQAIGCAGLTEPEHGSDLAALTTSAVETADGWRLNGQKSWITNAAVADVFTTLAQTDPASGNAGLASFVVESAGAGFIREPAYALEGLHAIGVGGFRLDNYLAPREALLDPPGAGFKRTLASINGARCYVAAMCAGMLESAISLAVGRATRRAAFGQQVFDFQGVRWSLVDAYADLAAMRLLSYRAARQLDAGQDATESAALAKKFAGEHALPHIAACIQAMGAEGLRAQYPLMRHLAACKATCYTDGSTEMMNERLGKIVRQKYADG